jgi:hypothetical protein
MKSTSAVEVSSQAVSPELIVESAAEAVVVMASSAATVGREKRGRLVRKYGSWSMVGWLEPECLSDEPFLPPDIYG